MGRDGEDARGAACDELASGAADGVARIDHIVDEDGVAASHVTCGRWVCMMGVDEGVNEGVNEQWKQIGPARAGHGISQLALLGAGQG
jgi:hypothetical protein